MKRIVFLESNQNLVWTSMQEILPCIKESWRDFADNNQRDLLSINVDNSSPRQFLKEIMASDVIVVSCFNGRIAQFLEVIRVHLLIDTPWVFYLHGLTTVGLWPIASLGLGNVITNKDIFIGTCKGDEECLRLSIPGATYIKGTFFSQIEGTQQRDIPAVKKDKLDRLVYIGRLSRQKNIHQLLWSLSVLKSEDPEKYGKTFLDIFGKEDGLDAPNMGLTRQGYLEELRRVTFELGLKEGQDYKFHGFVKRQEIFNSLKEGPFLFTSFSLHSDENFGMAALMALEAGGRLLLSEWGGHQNFLEDYPKRVSTVPVRLVENGPALELEDCLSVLRSSLEGESDTQLKSSFSKEKAIESLVGLERSFRSFRSSVEVIRLKFSPLVKQLMDTRGDSELQQRVFIDYKDSNAHEFFKAYGAKVKHGKINLTKSEKIALAPWAQSSSGFIHVNDPHRGLWHGSEAQAIELGYAYIKKAR